MDIIEEKFQHEIEVEQMWVVTEHGKYVFLSMLQVSAVLVFGLWDIAPHGLLLLWLSLLTTINFFKWVVLRFYHTHKQVLTADVRKFKRIVLFFACLTGLCWSVCVVWFLEPTQPLNVLIISITLTIEIVGAMLTWTSYLPAVIAISVPPAIPLVSMLFLQGGKVYWATSLILSILTVMGILSSLKLARVLKNTLSLNFENVALRRGSEEKSGLLERALVEADQANAAKTRFLAAASHDLRQPIHALGLFFAELSDRVYSPETAPVIGQVEDSIAAINSMLNALLDVSKLDAGVIAPNIATFSLTDIFRRLQMEFQPIAVENHNELRVRATDALVKSDPAMLERMLRNLIGNALRYTKNGQILMAARKRGQNFEIQVFDTGVGIPADQFDDIFIEFHQLHNPARDRRQGLGLGLAIVKRLAKLLQHEIRVRSRLGCGSCFSIQLPAVDKATNLEADKAGMSEHLPGNPLAGCHVLVVDDDIAVLEGMRGLLSRWGCRVITAASEPAATDKLAATSQKIQVLMIDYRLSDYVSGIEVAKHIQDLLAYPIAVLIITGDTGPERLREADASGFSLLHKPVEPAKLRSSLQYLLVKLQSAAV